MEITRKNGDTLTLSGTVLELDEAAYCPQKDKLIEQVYRFGGNMVWEDANTWYQNNHPKYQFYKVTKILSRSDRKKLITHRDLLDKKIFIETNVYLNVNGEIRYQVEIKRLKDGAIGIARSKGGYSDRGIAFDEAVEYIETQLLNE